MSHPFLQECIRLRGCCISQINILRTLASTEKILFVLQMLAYASGKELAEASDSTAQAVADRYDSCGDGFKIDHLEAIKKVLEGKQPDFRS